MHFTSLYVHIVCRWLTLMVFIVLLLELLVLPVKAVESMVGNGQAMSCTEAELQDAVARGGLITFDCGSAPHTITVSDDLQITQDTIIDGGGTIQGGLITISGGDSTRVFSTSNGAALTVRNLTIANGKEPGRDGRGGGIRGGWRSPITVINSTFVNNDGTGGRQESGGGAIFVHASTLVVADSVFVGNKGINGGAINNLLSSLTVTNSTFRDNDATTGAPVNHGYGGAIYTDGASEYTDDGIGGTIAIRGSTFTGNHGAGQGGAMFSFVYPPDKVVIADSTFEGNVVSKNAHGDALGGGLRHGNGELVISSTTFADNLARGQGGGFWTDGRHPGTLTNVTFANNRAVEDDISGNGGLGGAIAGNGNWTCTNCTIAGNHAGYAGGAIFGGEQRDTVLANSIVANNTAFNNGENWNKNQNCAGELGDGGHNLQFPARNPAHDNTQDPDPNCTAGITIAKPQLQSLTDNGGATQTMALAASSPAVHAGNPATCPAIDQRGFMRAGVCDSGAYEAGGVPFVPTDFVYLPSLVR